MRITPWLRRLLPRRAAVRSEETSGHARAILINLDRDAERLRRATAALARQDIATIRLPALLGTALPQFLRERIPGEVGPGSLGCFLSHVRAWETIAAGEHGAIVLEDDMQILRDLRECHELAARSGLDLLFMNARMAPPKGPQRRTGSEILALDEAILSRTGQGGHACGADGYYLSPRGARAMISLVQRTGVWDEVDWTLLVAAVGRARLPSIAGNPLFAGKLGQLAARLDVSEPLLGAAALRSPAVRHGGMGSTRLELNRR
ncbi:MAG TPA: glycosyltransferase family 25 protein [Devosia sp.]|nr:glycosyltransferase family 25 protein [Devosia sp.]